MKRIYLFGVVVLAAGLSGFCLTRWICGTERAGEMAWLCSEFRLTSAQAGEIAKLHAAYEPICAEHCRKVAEAKDRLRALERMEARAGAEYARALAEWDALRAVCTQATRQHLAAVAAQMSPEQGERYLALVTPKLAGHEHSRPLGLK